MRSLTRPEDSRRVLGRGVRTLLFLSATMGAPSQSSAAGVLALLSDPEPQLKQYALKALNQLVPQFWAEISEHIALMYVVMPAHHHLAHAPPR